MTRVSTAYKTKYDFPNTNGEFVCTKCQWEGNLPANYCMNCGKELEDHQKKGENRMAKFTAEQIERAAENGVSKTMLYNRTRKGWDIERAITTPKIDASESGKRGGRLTSLGAQKQVAK